MNILYLKQLHDDRYPNFVIQIRCNSTETIRILTYNRETLKVQKTKKKIKPIHQENDLEIKNILYKVRAVVSGRRMSHQLKSVKRR